jgi:hypothetical protein
MYTKEQTAARRARYRKLGVCILGRKHGVVFKAGLCESCYRKNSDGKKERYQAKARSTYSCSRCWHFGHNVRTCTAKRARKR